jgi:formate hydrogenlyase transcriptional activator
MPSPPSLLNYRNYRDRGIEAEMKSAAMDHRIHEIAVESSPNGIIVCDDSGTILYVNGRTETIFGYRADELVDSRIELLLPEASRAADADERDRFWENLQARRNGAGELHGRRKDGSEVPVEVDLMVANGGGPNRIVASVVDVTERRERELCAQVSAERRIEFERLVSNLAAAFVSVEAAQVDEAIIDSQRQMVEALDIDRCGLWQFTDDGENLAPTHSWVRPGCPPLAAADSVKRQFPWFLSKVRANEVVWFETLDDVPSAFDRESLRQFGAKSSAIIPMCVAGHVMGALSLTATRYERRWDPEVLERLRHLGAVIAQVLMRRKGQMQLERALEEIRQLRDQLASENVQLHHEVRSLKTQQHIAAESDSVRAALAQAESVAPTDSTVLLLGETGSGKEMFAQAIHDLSARRGRPMVRVNCAAIPTALMESELFGRERGAYTGALSREIGRFELAHGTTIFLDEVGDLPLEAQAKLLRVLQDKTLERLGSVRPIKVDVRVIAATNRDLDKAVAERTFREDLFYRLNVFPITVPPLRDRQEDIAILVWAFIDEFSKAFNKRIDSISRESLLALQRYAWPGNVRELRNVIERAVIVAKGPRLVIDLPRDTAAARSDRITLFDVEADHIREVMKSVGWRVRGTGGAAELLGMKPTTLDSRMAKLGVRRPSR